MRATNLFWFSFDHTDWTINSWKSKILIFNVAEYSYKYGDAELINKQYFSCFVEDPSTLDLKVYVK